MLEQSETSSSLGIRHRSLIRAEYQKTLFLAQPQSIQTFFWEQSWLIVQVLKAGKKHLRFAFPEFVMLPELNCGYNFKKTSLPPRYRRQQVGSLLRVNDQHNLTQNLLDRLNELQRSNLQAISICTGILRYLLAANLFEDLPRLSEIAETDLIIPKGFHPANDTQLRFQQIESVIKKLMLIFTINPVLLEEENFLSYYNAVLAQWFQVGQAYAEHETLEIIRVIRQRAQGNSLNRGLSIELPYFDDQALELRTFYLEVIPPSRIVFEPAFVVDAVVRAKEQVEQDSTLSQWTRVHLLAELDLIQKSFAIHQPYTPVGMLFQTTDLLPIPHQGSDQEVTR